MITDAKDKWHFITRKSITALLRGVTSTYNGDYYCLNCFLSYRTDKKKQLLLNKNVLKTITA